MTRATSKDLLLINGAAFLRSLTIGLTGVVVGVYLSRVGFSPLKIGIVIGFGLAGAAASSVVVTLRADRLGRRRTLHDPFFPYCHWRAGPGPTTEPAYPSLPRLCGNAERHGYGSLCVLGS